MATYTTLSLLEARTLGEHFGLRVEAAVGLCAGSVNSNVQLGLADGGRAFLRIYEEQSEEGARGEAELLTWLTRRAVPAVAPLQRLDGAGSLASFAGKPVAIFPWVPGDIRCQAGVTVDDTRSVGAALARVHLAGSPAPRAGRFDVSNLLERCDRIERAPDPELRALAPFLREHLDRASHSRNPHASTGLIHGDLFRDNVLWRDLELAALLDFESACDGVFVFDLAVTWLAWCFGDAFRDDLGAGLVAGYGSVRSLTEADVSGFVAEAKLAALRFMTTRITDYAMRAHLGANVPRDFRRFQRRYEAIDAAAQPLLVAGRARS